MSRISGGDAAPSAPAPAARSSPPGWRDPRLWIGVAIVAVSVVVGARVLASSDDTVAVWAVAADASRGDHLASADLVGERVRFTGDDDLGRYYQTTDELPADLTLLRDLGAGELLPRTAVGAASDPHTAQISIEVSPGLVPTDVTRGSVVDVYLVAGRGDGRGGGRAEPGPALERVRVVDAPSTAAGFGGEAQRQLVLALDDDAVADYYARLGALTDPVLTVVSHPR